MGRTAHRRWFDGRNFFPGWFLGFFWLKRMILPTILSLRFFENAVTKEVSPRVAEDDLEVFCQRISTFLSSHTTYELLESGKVESFILCRAIYYLYVHQFNHPSLGQQ